MGFWHIIFGYYGGVEPPAPVVRESIIETPTGRPVGDVRWGRELDNRRLRQQLMRVTGDLVATASAVDAQPRLLTEFDDYVSAEHVNHAITLQRIWFGL